MFPYKGDLHLKKRAGNYIILENIVQVLLHLEIQLFKAFILLRYVLMKAVSPKPII